MSTQTFELPDLGEGLTEAEVVRWLVAVGDEIVIDQAVVEVETAKSLVEVPSPYAGTVSVLHGEEGETIDVGRPLISVDAEGSGPALGSALLVGEQYRAEEKAGSGNVLIGYGTSDSDGRGRRRRPRATVLESGAVARVATVPAGTTAARISSPLVRRLARDAGIPILGITGTGVNGLITRRDVEAAIARTATQPESEPGGIGVPAPPVAQADDVTARTGLPVSARTPMSGFRKAVATALSRSRAEVPEATVWVDVDFTELFALRAQSKAVGREVPSLLGYLARFTVAALKTYPELNGEVDTVRNELVQYDGINLGVAMQTNRGLIVPAVLAAHRRSTLELDGDLKRLMASAREGKATHTELTGGTFTLNNYGAFNVDGSAAIVNHPQVAILGFGRIIDRPWVVDGQIAVRKIGQMSFVFDHRVCDGGVAASFMRVVADAIEQPAQAIAHL